MIIVFVRRSGIDLGLLLFIYVAKSYFLLHRRTTILITAFTVAPWIISDYLAEVDWAKNSLEPIPRFIFDPGNPLKFVLINLIIYISASTFVIMASSMAVTEKESRQRADDLAQQVESLVATLERTRIAREIHDSLGHTLTDLDIQLEVAQKLRHHNPELAFQAVDTAKILAGQCIEDVSQALNRMRQSDFNLNQALAALLDAARQDSALQVSFQVNLPQLPIHKSYQIYCITKEAIMNVQKHARASQLSLIGRLTPDGIMLEIEDNGIGFDAQKLRTGFGIQGMVERAQLLGGKLEIQTSYAQGTHIQIILPA
ncbi:hypothetical protein DSM106972_098890 [Dulcicalothrix desertica PCC 7102]|uniref:histidine kinase n=2 Tax=Dulcicalothrix desertica TaxID=32056 RepID=A0A3S1BNY5_9CYAN|nr:hypothetical protein DSM106972_098890 [Dulcicalothrix desertica PCC 7102]